MSSESDKQPDISVNLCGIRLSNPTVLASGILGISRGLLMRVAESGAGAATIKSVTLQPRDGHNNPTVIAYEAGMLNAVGYSNPGVQEAVKEFRDMDTMPIPIFASAVGRDGDEFACRFPARIRPAMGCWPGTARPRPRSESCVRSETLRTSRCS